MRIISKEELKDIISKHHKWLINEDGGERANLRSADLSSADLSYADLRSANLSSADLDKRYIQISCIGSRKDITTYCFDDDIIFCGCFKGTLKEFEAKILETYPEKDNQYHKEYIEAIKYIKSLQK